MDYLEEIRKFAKKLDLDINEKITGFRYGTDKKISFNKSYKKWEIYFAFFDSEHFPTYSGLVIPVNNKYELKLKISTRNTQGIIQKLFGNKDIVTTKWDNDLLKQNYKVVSNETGVSQKIINGKLFKQLFESIPDLSFDIKNEAPGFLQIENNKTNNYLFLVKNYSWIDNLADLELLYSAGKECLDILSFKRFI